MEVISVFGIVALIGCLSTDIMFKFIYHPLILVYMSTRPSLVSGNSFAAIGRIAK
jgi:hypothetical protein